MHVVQYGALWHIMEALHCTNIRVTFATRPLENGLKSLVGDKTTFIPQTPYIAASVSTGGALAVQVGGNVYETL